MEHKPLGATGVIVPEIGLGTWKYTGGDGPLRRGIALGANLVDTAEMYRNEVEVGQAIAPVRDQVFLATKVLGSHLRYDQVLKAAEESLRKLTVDQIDLYQVHWPNNRVPIAETMRAMEELVDRGVVRYIGVSNFSLPQLKETQASSPVTPSYPTKSCTASRLGESRRGCSRIARKTTSPLSPTPRWPTVPSPSNPACALTAGSEP